MKQGNDFCKALEKTTLAAHKTVTISSGPVLYNYKDQYVIIDGHVIPLKDYSIAKLFNERLLEFVTITTMQ